MILTLCHLRVTFFSQNSPKKKYKRKSGGIGVFVKESVF